MWTKSGPRRPLAWPSRWAGSDARDAVHLLGAELLKSVQVDARLLRELVGHVRRDLIASPSVTVMRCWSHGSLLIEDGRVERRDVPVAADDGGRGFLARAAQQETQSGEKKVSEPEMMGGIHYGE
ncbi:hypothetical protein PHYPSEUDO_012240 [Phytophthora pseudosyringae]|uniref:Uncharacterized protein n=1 Tax=Phytophthora pseudosyringae TaxID=221518 RepID=A0A8T1V9X1_9STRA|nr:hypothetical protein PHYPSEUDO_012240 [Phytophthora pseudosyringae]